MSFDSIQTLLETTAGELVTADYDSVQDVVALCSSFEKLRDTALAFGLSKVPDALNRSIELINSLTVDDTTDRSAVLDTLNQWFSAIQYALRPGSDSEKLRLPVATVQRSTPPSDKPFSLPDHLDRELFVEFITDQEHVLAHMEVQLLSLEKKPSEESIGNLKRLFHTLKGEAAVFELRQVERLCHTAEDWIEQADAVPVDSLLIFKDWLKECFDALKLDQPVPPFSSDLLALLFPSSDDDAVSSSVSMPELDLPPSYIPRKFELSPFIASEIFDIFIEDQQEALNKMGPLIERLEDGSDLEALSGLKCLFHTMNGGSGVCGLSDIERLCCHVEDAIEKNPAVLTPGNLVVIKQWLTNVFDALKAEQPVPVLEDSLLENIALPAQWYPGEQTEDSLAASAPFFDDAIFNDFVAEQQSVAATLEALILRFEKNPDTETLEELKRVFHTLKGEARVFGLQDIEKLCHTVEDILDTGHENLRGSMLLNVKDFLARCFSALKNHVPLPELTPSMLAALSVSADTFDDDSSIAAVVYNPLKGPIGFQADSEDEIRASEDLIAAASSPRSLMNADLDLLSDFVSEVKEHIENINDSLLSLENNPGDSDLLNAVFRVFHTVKGAAGFLALDDISRLSHVTESLLDSARKGDLLLKEGSIDVVFEAVDEMKNLVSTIETAISTGANEYLPSSTVDPLIDKINNILSSFKSLAAKTDVSEGDADVHNQSVSVSSDDVSGLVLPPASNQDELKSGAVIMPESIAPATGDEPDSIADEFIEIQYEQDDPESEQVAPSSGKQSAQQQRVTIKDSIKVDAENLDKLIDAIGELVIIEAMIRQDTSIKQGASSTLLRNITQMDKITRELQTLGMSLRMIPIKSTFQKMARVVRDLARKSDKKIEFNTRGEDTMLDKSVVDRIGDPLIHLVRNAVDHGIEATHEDRRQTNKNTVGQIMLTAFHKGGNIYVEIKDDGRGLNRDAIQNKALEKGLIQEGHNLTDNEIYNLIFLPGFSTAGKVTDVSGRGVGMDVVRRTIEDLRGNIEITSSEGRGTTISLRLPLTLAIIDGMLVRIGDERYIIPTLSIVESFRPRTEDITTVVNKGEMVFIRDKLIPLFRLADLFKIKGAVQHNENSIVIVVEDSGRMTGIMVDELLGQQSTVIKSLGALKGLAGISGGSIMTDGSVGIILDIGGIVKLATGGENLENTS